jgi:hypothetical protein
VPKRKDKIIFMISNLTKPIVSIGALLVNPDESARCQRKTAEREMLGTDAGLTLIFSGSSPSLPI